jgi:uncharacterized membrane protein
MNNILNDLIGTIATVASVGGMILVVLFAIRSGMNKIGTVLLFLIICLCAYLMKNPDKVQGIGAGLYSLLFGFGG